VLIAGAVLLLALLTLASYLAFARAQGDRIDVGVTAYEVLGDSSISISFEVAKPRGSVAVCLLQALDRASEVVGEASVRVAAVEERVTTTQVLATSGRAATGTAIGCRREPTPEQQRP